MVATGAAAPTTTTAPTAVMGMHWLAPRGQLAGHLADGLDQFLGHPADRRENFAQG